MGANNSEFWDITYRNNGAKLLGVLRRYVKDVYIAKDLLHEAFITAIDKYSGFKGKGSFEGWLYRITVNTALMYLRKEQTTQPLQETIYLVADNDNDDYQGDDVKSTIEAAGFSNEELLAAIDKLPVHHKLVFNMYVIDGFSHKQIGSELNISPGTSKSHLARARKKIQKLLYEETMNREKNKEKNRERRRASIFLLLFPAKEHYIDKMYREGFSDFKIPPPSDTSFISTALEQQAASTAVQTAATTGSQAIQTATFWGGKSAYIGVSCGTAALTGAICWMTMSVNSPFNREQIKNYEPVIVNIEDNQIYSPDLIEQDNTDFDETNYTEFTIPESDKKIEQEISSELNLISETELAQKSDTQPVTKDSPSAEESSEPVVVKKQIIQHQTVVVRDTVIIYE